MTTPPPLLDPLVERLRYHAPTFSRPGIAAVMAEAATALEALAAENGALREALQQCATWLDGYDSTLGELARATLERTPQP